jgi:hypothetical protein
MRSSVIVRDREIASRTSPPGPSQPEGSAVVAEKRFLTVLRYLDVVLVLVGAAVALALGAPALGCAIGAGAWVAQRILAHVDGRWISNATEPRTQLGLNLAEAFGRIWLLAGAIVLAGVVGGHKDGLTAALVIFGAYSVAFAIRVLSGRPSPPTARGLAR